MLVLHRVARRQCYCLVKRGTLVMKETGASQLFQFARHLSQSFVDSIGAKPILVREFIHSALYNPEFGYFATRPDAVGVLPEPLSFDSLKGRSAFRQLLDSLYKQNDAAWFTPVELFKPWYGYAIGEYILQSYNPEFPLQVLDNLPHDLIYKETSASPWMETCVFMDQSCPARLKELYRPLQDPNVQLFLNIIEREQDYQNFVLKWFSTMKKIFLKYWPLPRKIWIPTVCLQLLQTLHDARPNMYLIASDFSTLPDVKVEGESAPLVATKRNGITQDYSTYLNVRGDADIFFPTDFSLLERLDKHCSSMVNCRADRGSKNRDRVKRHSSIIAPAQFMSHFGDITKTKTKDGYNPLLDDYGNTKLYLSTPINDF